MSQAKLIVQFRSCGWKVAKSPRGIAHVRGWADVGSRILHAEELAQNLLHRIARSNNIDLRGIGQLVDAWNGNFAFVLELPTRTILGADRIRSIPLVYTNNEDGVFISDDFDWVSEASNNRELNIDCAEEFLTSGFVFGDGTLHKYIKGVQAGEIVELTPKATASHRYYTFTPSESNRSFDSLESEYERIDRDLESSVRRMVDSAPNVNQWVVPLSGGYDSRIILNYLHRTGQDNVICFSYGRSGNRESEISQQVAEALGYDFHFVAYDARLWNRLMKEKGTHRFLRLACNGVSLPILQDFAAISVLREKGVLQANDVVVPGHTFDFLAGGHLRPEYLRPGNKPSSLSHAIERRHAMFWWDANGGRQIRQRIRALFSTLSTNDMEMSFASQCEFFNWQERQAKFIVNSCRVYEYLGFDWRVPLWDHSLMNYWQMVPLPLRLNRQLLKDAFWSRLALREIRRIPIYGDNRQSRTTQRLPIISSVCAGTIGRMPTFRRMIRYYVTPKQADSAMALEECFTNTANTVGDLLSGPKGTWDHWPATLRRHFRWYESHPTKRPGIGANALLVAHVLAAYLNERGSTCTSELLKAH